MYSIAFFEPPRDKGPQLNRHASTTASASGFLVLLDPLRPRRAYIAAVLLCLLAYATGCGKGTGKAPEGCADGGECQPQDGAAPSTRDGSAAPERDGSAVPDAGCDGGACLESCTQHDDCPDGLCVDGECAERECTSGDECTSGMCAMGVCTEPECDSGADCESGVCAAHMCELARCTDGVRNGTETDVDCGGECGTCPDAAACLVAGDCSSLSCAEGVCLSPTCEDGIVNGDETGNDCGGSTCHPCGERPDGGSCSEASECASDVCLDDVCAMPTCEDGVRNGDETDEDCGGESCDACDDGFACLQDSDCTSLVCDGGFCAEPSCEDDAVNGTETDLGCGGGGCEACAVGGACLEGTDCVTGVCADGACVAATCDDDVRNDDETDVDCGGGCGPCADLQACLVPGDCESGVCEGEICQPASCTDEVTNGDETDTDCGGGGDCDTCARGEACVIDGDCASLACRGDRCVVGPTAGFTLDSSVGYAPFYVTATSTATPGDGTIVSVEYDWGDGFTTDDTYRFDGPGSFSVTQRVSDELGLSATTTQSVTVTPWTPTCLNDGDRTDNVVLTDGCLVVEMRNTTMANGGVRTTSSLAPGSGVFYFEGERLGRAGNWGFGVTVADQDLTGDWGGDKSFLYTSAGIVGADGGAAFVGASSLAGVVVDYRGASPEVFLVLDYGDGSTVAFSQQLGAITEPVQGSFQGLMSSHGPMAQFNFGDDTTNHPFQLDPVAALVAAGETEVADALVLGFGRTRALPATTAPVLTTGPDVSVPLGTEVTLTAEASDAEDGDLTADITWENLAVSYYERERGTGGSFTFTPDDVGVYPIAVAVEDALGVSREARITVTVTGSLTQYPTVQLVPRDNTGSEINLSPDGLSAHFGGGSKQGVLANQGIYDDFWYFEVQSHNAPLESTGSGLTVLRGSLDPMDFETAQYSMQVNFLGSIWRDLIFEAGVDTSSGYVGYAVDYRGDSPIVYVIIEDVMVYELPLDYVSVPLYPTVYGDATESTETWDSTINFGASAFHNDPTTALDNAGVDTTGFEVGWGDINTP